MSFDELKLIAPNSLDIVGIKHANTVCGFSCKYCKQTNTQLWTIPPNAINSDDNYIFVDSSGNEWELNQNDVVYNSLTKNTFIEFN